MSTTKRLDEAREAFIQKNLSASKKAHDEKTIESAIEQHGSESSQFIGNMVYGGLDGIISIFAVVSGVAGANLTSGVLLILGAANLLGDGLSMGIGAFLSMKSEKEYYQKERERESWEAENYPEGEKNELIAIYKSKGYPKEDAEKLVEIQTRDQNRWVDAMMVNELSMIKDERKPISAALMTFGSFFLFGLLPLLVYLVDAIFHTNLAMSTMFLISILLSGLSLFGLGAAKYFTTRRNPLVSGLEMLIVGGLAASVAYLIGVLLKPLGG
ncbi:MAG: VIT1/CCC1 transporter family protein [Flexilinea sp.]